VVITILIVLICLAGVSVLGFIAWKLINKKRKFKLMKGGDND
jgi:hypothetical protein